MIGCLQLASPGEAVLHALRLRLDRLSPRVQLWRTPEMVALLLDLGRGTVQDGRRHAAALHRAADAATVPNTHVGIAPTPTLAALAARRAASDGPLVVSPGAVPALLARCPVGWLALPNGPAALAALHTRLPRLLRESGCALIVLHPLPTGLLADPADVGHGALASITALRLRLAQEGWLRRGPAIIGSRTRVAVQLPPFSDAAATLSIELAFARGEDQA